MKRCTTHTLLIVDCQIISSDISVLASMEKLCEVVFFQSTYSEIKMDFTTGTSEIKMHFKGLSYLTRSLQHLQRFLLTVLMN